MNFSQSFRLAIKSLMTSKMRALLTMLGIIIGVAAVIIITSLGNGMEVMMNEQFEKLGANLIQVQIMDYGTSSRSVSPDDMKELVEKYPQYLSGFTPYVSVQGVVRQGGDEFERTSVYGVGQSFLNERGETMSGGQSVTKGRFLTYVDVEYAQSVCVIGSYLEKTAFQGNALDQTITIKGVPFKVVGVLKEGADSEEGSADDQIYIPYTNALRLNGTSNASLYLFTSATKDLASIGKGLIETRLYQIFQDDPYFVMTSAEMMDAMNTMLNTLMIVLVAIAAISLLVGGIGIMNIMLVSVTERTREIGIRKSLGAKGKDIRGQFIIEAGTTSAIGGILGIGLGVALAGVVGKLIASLMSGAEGYSAVPTVGSIAIAFGVSVAIGILFGYLPANKAAKLNPIDALRYD